MKIISWNCKSNLENLFIYLADENPDIVIVQEMHGPKSRIEKKLRKMNNGYILLDWRGEEDREPRYIRGIGVLYKKSYFDNNNKIPEVMKINFGEYNDICIGELLEKCHIAFSVGQLKFIAIWANTSFSKYLSYKGQLLFLLNSLQITKDFILFGDFNTSDISFVNNIVNDAELKSVYHNFKKEKRLKESKVIKFGDKNEDKTYYKIKGRGKSKNYIPTSHIDYIFADLNKITYFDILKHNGHSDHDGMIFCVKIEK